MDDNLRQRVAVVLDHLDEQMRSGAQVVRELLAEAETARARVAELEAELEVAVAGIVSLRVALEVWDDPTDPVESTAFRMALLDALSGARD